MGNGKSEFFEEKCRELLKVFFSKLGQGDSIEEVIAIAAESPCSRFWISTETAIRNIRMKEKGRPTRRTEVIDEIMKRCNGDYSRDNIERVVYSPAPKFYITPKTAKKLVYSELKKRKSCDTQKQKSR